MCEEFLKTEFSQKECDIFRFINNGIYKSDFWRVCILYKYGGVYVDADIEALTPLNQFIEEDDTFATCLSCFPNEFNPHFIMCEPGNPNIKLCIDEFISFYDEKMAKNEVGVYLSVCPVFAKIFKYVFDNGCGKDGKHKIGNEVIKLMKEQYIHGIYKFCTYGNLKLLNNKDDNYPKKYN